MPPEVLPVRDECGHSQLRSFHDECVAPPLDLSIIVVNWNTRSFVRDCLESVLSNLGSLVAEVIVIDNASTDGSAEMITCEFPEVRLIANDTNHGFAAANNQGMRIAKGRYVLLLNPDTVVLEGALEHTVAYAERHPSVGIVGCQVMEREGVIQRTCFRFPSTLSALMWMAGLHGRFPRSRIAAWASYGSWNRDTPRDVDVVSGMFMLVRSKALQDVGLMDEAYFVYAEETDWCYRFWRAGWRCVFAPVGVIIHVDGGHKSTDQASVKMYVEMQKSLLRFHRKHSGAIRWRMIKFLFLTAMVLRTLWWSLWACLGVGALSRHKARQSAAAWRFHWTGAEPKW